MRHPSLIPLSQDHHHGLALALKCRKQSLGQMKPMGSVGLKERANEMRDFFNDNLERHFKAEEEVLFPFMGSFYPESQSLLDILVKEHKQIRGWVGLLQHPSGLAKILFDLGDLLERHIRREERELFPIFESRTTEVDAERLKRKLGSILKNG